ncbi:MAG TPA: hypothetical protein PKE45_06695 [Caldilineaceae bacterium]|nr:hypothetical protein [Caldilineaceae bacterium]
MKTESMQRIMIVVLLIVVGLLVYAQTGKSVVAQENSQSPYQVGAFQIQEMKYTVRQGSENVERTGTILLDSINGKTWLFDPDRGRWKAVPVSD